MRVAWRGRREAADVKWAVEWNTNPGEPGVLVKGQGPTPNVKSVLEEQNTRQAQKG
jgi:hypothetical protein